MPAHVWSMYAPQRVPWPSWPTESSDPAPSGVSMFSSQCWRTRSRGQACSAASIMCSCSVTDRGHCLSARSRIDTCEGRAVGVAFGRGNTVLDAGRVGGGCVCVGGSVDGVGGGGAVASASTKEYLPVAHTSAAWPCCAACPCVV